MIRPARALLRLGRTHGCSLDRSSRLRKLRWRGPTSARAASLHCRLYSSSPPPRAVGLAWDVETTGLPPCDIVQIAVTCADWEDEPYSSFVRYIMPSVPIHPDAERIHGISMELLVEWQAQSLAAVLTELASWLDSTFGPERRLVWAAHNGRAFDERVLRKGAVAAGCKMPRGLEASAHTVDTLHLARVALKAEKAVSSHTLENLYQLATGTSLDDAHDALADAKAVATVWRWLIETCGADPRSSEFATHLGETHAAGIHRSRRRVAAEKSTLRPDDLQSLPGIGPAIDKQLRSIEIASVPQLRAVIELAKATAGVTTMQWLRQNLTAHPGTLARIRDGVDRAHVQPVSPNGAVASDPAVLASSSINNEGAMYAAELRVIARQLMDHPSWGPIFQHDTSTIEDPVRGEGATGNVPTTFHHSNFQHLLQQIATDASRGRIFPPARCVFHAFELTPLDSVKVVIIGQDPYHGHNQAHGLCFSVERRVAIPPSLRNIFKEISDDPAAVTEGKFEVPTHGNLEAWAQQGVFLLNASLTVREGEANSHATMWASFTDEVIRGISERSNAGVVFLLWGGFARKKRTLVDTSRHRVIEAPHPSPLSASRGWFGSGVFSKCNVELQALGHKPIDWRVPV